MAKEKVALLITSAVMHEGEMIVPGKGEDSIVEVEHNVATNLLQRGKAELLTEDNAPGDEDETTSTPAKKAPAKKGAPKGD